MKLRRGDHERERTIIERQIDHLVRLVDDLLDISRITRGTVELVRAPIALRSAITQAVESTQPLLEQRRHDLTIDVSDSLVVDADFHRLTQVIGNLVTNAAKYTPDGGRISITARAEGDMARIVVRDNGVGIAASLLARVFDMFVQGVDRAEGGLGLGLAIVKNLAENHGGRVRAESAGPGSGATFTVWWPRVDSVATLEPEQRLPAQRRPLRVLVVDDNVDAAITLGELLKVLGHEPVVAYDAPSAIAIAKHHPPELALVDLGLPVLDGYELLARLRGLPGLEALPAVAVTGYGQASDRARTAAAGFDRHLVKPVGLDDLRTLFASLG
jgi:CheY-like chemotaxis protein/two-component sensor histidine kinase